MLNEISRVRLVGAWCAAVVVIGVCGVAAGAAPNLGNGALLVATCLMPPAIVLFIRRNASPLTVAELLSAVNRPSKEVRP